MSISGYQIVPNSMSSDDISHFANTCHSKSVQSVVTVNDFIGKPLRGVDVIAPSKCDSEYNIIYTVINHDVRKLKVHENVCLILFILIMLSTLY